MLSWLKLLLLVALVFVSHSGQSSPLYRVGNRDSGWNHGKKLSSQFLDSVQPVFTARCVTCHGCYEAPCQLNLQSFDAILRGYNPTAIYSGKRVPYTHPTRLNEADSVRGWRALGFLPVVANDVETAADMKSVNAEKGLLYRFLEQGKKNTEGFAAINLEKIPHDEHFDKRQCVATQSQFNTHFAKKNPWNVTTFEKFISENPEAGMPFGLPRLNDAEHKQVVDWLKAGTLAPRKEALEELEAAARPEVIQNWEAFFNQNSAKSRHTSRYLYEHVFTAILHFDENPGEYFELVRSKTKTGPIAEIVTELPYEAPPDGGPVFYRLKKVTRAIVQKTQNIWRLNDTRLAHLAQQFLAADWRIAQIPEPVYGSNNMFEYFSVIPAEIRSKFMMENSRLIVGAMVQGTVCIGSRATFAIADHFWTFFLKPEADPSVVFPTLGLDSSLVMGTAPQAWEPRTAIGKRLLEDADRLGDLKDTAVAKKLLALMRRLGEIAPIGGQSDEGDDLLAEAVVEMRKAGMTTLETLQAVHHYVKSSERNQTYQAAYEAKLRELLAKRKKAGLGLEDLWRGDGDPVFAKTASPDAWLNITRHGLSATVQYGSEGGAPQSIWVMSYSNFERLYYNLVAHFKVWGSVTHKLATWRHMSYVRLEGEDLAISLLPPAQRSEVRSDFTSGLGALKDSLFFPLHSNSGKPRPAVHPEFTGKTTKETVQKFVTELKSRYATVLKAGTVNAELVSAEQLAFETKLQTLQSRSVRNTKDKFAQFFPNIAYVRIEDGAGKHWVYTLQADRDYNSHNLVLMQDQVRNPEGDTLAVYRGTVGAYPGAFFDVKAQEQDKFIGDLQAITSEAQWKAFLKDYGVERNRGEIWTYFDWLHEWKALANPGNDPVEQGIVDMSQYLFF